MGYRIEIMVNRIKRLLFENKNIEVTAEKKFSDKVLIHHSAIIEQSNFEDWVNIQRDCYFYHSSVDSYSYFAGFNSVMNAKIGKFCSIGSSASIGPGKHPIEYVSTSPVFFSPQKQCGVTFADKSYYREMGSIKIGNDVWIGANAIILDDVTIGDGAVIAASAVVTSNVEPYAIVGGIPAKFIRKRFSDEIIAQLLEFKWWDKNEEWLRQNFKSFHNMDDFEKLMSSSRK